MIIIFIKKKKLYVIINFSLEEIKFELSFSVLNGLGRDIWLYVTLCLTFSFKF